MLTKVLTHLPVHFLPKAPLALASRPFTALADSDTAANAWKKSCYHKIDFTISDDATVFEAVQRFSAYNIGCLVTTDSEGRLSGVISERDYVNKIALLGRKSQETMVSEVYTSSHNLITARVTDSVDTCMAKMLTRDIRHLPLLDDDNKCVGMLSVKDIIKEVVHERNKTIESLANFALGKGGHYVCD